MASNLVKYQRIILNMTARPEDSKTLAIAYTTTDTKVSERVHLIDGYSFISSVGGNLGLFIGFSFLSFLFEAYDWIVSKISQSSQHRF